MLLKGSSLASLMPQLTAVETDQPVNTDKPRLLRAQAGWCSCSTKVRAGLSLSTPAVLDQHNPKKEYTRSAITGQQNWDPTADTFLSTGKRQMLCWQLLPSSSTPYSLSKVKLIKSLLKSCSDNCDNYFRLGCVIIYVILWAHRAAATFTGSILALVFHKNLIHHTRQAQFRLMRQKRSTAVLLHENLICISVASGWAEMRK